MNILMLSDVYFPRVNGVSTSISIFRRELRALGHQVHLIVPDYPQKPDDDPDIRRIPARYLIADPEDRMMRTGALLALTNQLSEQDFDVLHIQTPFIAHHVGIRLARRLGIPAVATYHTFFEEYLHHYLPFIPRALARFAARRFSAMQCNELEGLVVPSTAMAERLKAYGVHSPMHIIPTGLDAQSLLGGQGQAFKAQRGIPADRPTLLHVGRIAHEKNVDFLLYVLDEVRRAIPEVVMIIAGEGPALPHIQRLGRRLGLGAHLYYVGYLDRQQALPDCYAAGDVFVFASRTETQGLVLLEALSVGVPVVSTAVMGTRDILIPEGGGALLAEDDLGDFAAKVISLLRNPALRTRLGAEAPTHAARWKASFQAVQLEKFYTDIVQHKASVEPSQLPVGTAAN